MIICIEPCVYFGRTLKQYFPQTIILSRINVKKVTSTSQIRKKGPSHGGKIWNQPTCAKMIKKYFLPNFLLLVEKPIIGTIRVLVYALQGYYKKKLGN